MGSLVEVANRYGNKLLVFLALILGIFSIGAYFFIGRGTRDSIRDQALERKLLVTRSGAATLESFFDLSTRSLQSLATRPEISSFSAQTPEILGEFLLSWKNTPLSGVTVIDASGKSRYLANEEGGGVGSGVNVSDRDYFVRAKDNPQDDFIAAPVVSRGGLSEGHYVVPIVVPITSQGEFNGLLLGSIWVSHLVDQYVSPLKLSDQTQVFVIDGMTGVMIVAEDRDSRGKDVFSAISENTFLGQDILVDKVKAVLAGGEEGKLAVALPAEGKLTPYFVTWVPMIIGDQRWFLAQVTPQQPFLEIVSPFYLKSIVAIYLGFMAILVVGIRMAKHMAYKEAVKAEHEFHDIPPKRH